MCPALTSRQLDAYHRDGFLSPVDVLTERDAAQALRELEAAEARVRGDAALALAVKQRSNYVLPHVDRLTRAPAILDAVASILGEDLLVWGCSLFAKPARSDAFVSWHQDLHYWGLDADEEVTAWLALSPASVESGCMRFIPGSHCSVAAHRDTFAESNLLSRGQELAVEVDEAHAVDAPLRPGQASLHHGRTFHASHPNRSAQRRVGLAIRYITPRMAQQSGDKALATLVRGSDSYGHFELFAGPRGVLTAPDLEVVRRALEINRRINYRGAAQAPPVGREHRRWRTQGRQGGHRSGYPVRAGQPAAAR